MTTSTPRSETSRRDYTRVLARLAPTGDRSRDMQAVVDALWDELSPRGASWVGFYLKTHGIDEMLLGPRRDKPACSPIGLHGACGRSCLSGRPLIVTDVANLRAGYIACDPRDRSELVIPCIDPADMSCWGVLDLDSHATRAFDQEDVVGIQRILEKMRLTAIKSTGVLDIETV